MNSSAPIEDMLQTLEVRSTPAFDARTLRDMFDATAASGAPRRARRTPLLWSSAAAIVVVATVLLCHRSVDVKRPVVQVMDPNTSFVVADPIEKERLLAESLFADRDLAGLRELLQSGRPQTQALVAQMLAVLGDREALPLLHTLATGWSGPSDENPFQAAMDQLASSEPNQLVPDANSAAFALPSLVATASAPQETGVSGIVVDTLTGAHCGRRGLSPRLVTGGH